jgi:stearoyl-CoA desaturase (delta-9 desaturase)
MKLPQANPIDTISQASKPTVLLMIVVPFLAVFVCGFNAWNGSLGKLELGLLGVFYAITMLGITVGFHRHFTHRSFEAHPAVRWALAVSGSMAIQGSVLSWAATHRRHHHHSDRAGDPHSPNLAARGFIPASRAFFHAHFGWMFGDQPAADAGYVGDLLRDPLVRRASNCFLGYAALGLLLPAVISGLIRWSFEGAWNGLLWGGFCRTFLVHHMTWSINSACHLWGTRTYAVDDESRNNWFCALATFGEGWHNNHHAFPSSARHGFGAWQIDLSYWLVVVLQRCRLVWDVRLRREPRDN